MERGGKRAVGVWHRRGGKDSTALNFTACAAHERVGTYWHMLPTLAQGRKVVWDGIDRDGRRMIDQAWPPEVRARVNKAEMKIELKIGSMWQVVGSDNYDSLVGTNTVGVVFSEWALADPLAWDYIRPILAENDGWAVFIYTARGRNHGAAMFEMAKQNPDWFAEKLTVDDTGVISPEVIAAERAAGMPEELIEQEFYCSFSASMVGAYYGKMMNQAEDGGRIGKVAWEPTQPVQTWWDLGIRDATAIWFVQLIGREIHLIDYYEHSGVGLDHYAKVLREKPYVYAEPMRSVGGHLLPHDAEVEELGTGRSRIEVLRSLGINGRVVPKWPPEDGIQAVRSILPRCWFDKVKCARGIEAMHQYRQDWDPKLQAFRGRPLHDWTSHAADAFRYGAVGLSEAPIGRSTISYDDEASWRVA